MFQAHSSVENLVYCFFRPFGLARLCHEYVLQYVSSRYCATSPQLPEVRIIFECVIASLAHFVVKSGRRCVFSSFHLLPLSFRIRLLTICLPAARVLLRPLTLSEWRHPMVRGRYRWSVGWSAGMVRGRYRWSAGDGPPGWSSGMSGPR